jgi:cytochrome c-type biogenesis protein CcmH
MSVFNPPHPARSARRPLPAGERWKAAPLATPSPRWGEGWGKGGWTWITAALLVAMLIVSISLLTPAPAQAVQPDEILPDSSLESRARVLSRELRCMVCQNQSIDDSDAPLARDLRILVRERLKAGDNDNQVIDFLVARYGEFVLLKPRVAWHTAVLWGAPMVLLAGGALMLLMFSRRRGGAMANAAAVDLSPQEQARLSELTAERDR